MQLFSRNKALVALSLGALTALGACGDDVTVPVAPAAPVTISITPPSATMNVGEKLNFAVQIGGGSTTAAPTLASCTSSNSAVVTAAVSGSACAVTAVAPGNATVTAAASTGQAAAAGVTVAAPANAISGMTVSPSAAQLAVGQTVTIVPNVTRAASSVNVTYTYTSSSATVATVSAAGVVTAVAPGTTTITVTAAGTGTGFSAATLTSATTITVSDRTPGLSSLQVSPSTVSMGIGATTAVTAVVQGPRASAATYSYNTSAPAIATATGTGATGTITAVAPGTATITVTASATQDGAFAASSITGLVSVTVTPAAQVIINSITKNGGTVDISNVSGQFEVNLALQPNGQNVSSVQAFVCASGETAAACVARGPAAQQTFGAAGGQAGQIQLYINSAEFTAPNFTTGADANTLYKNGLRTIIATITAAGQAPTASNNLSSVNFNNNDGWTIQWALPSNRANDVAGNTWYGGPGATGTGSFTVVPVMYTPGRTIGSVTINPATSGACGGNINLYARPFRGSYGAQTRDTLTGAFNCAGVVTDLNGHAPSVIASIDNNNAAGPNAQASAFAAPATTIFQPVTGTWGGWKYFTSLAYQPTGIFTPADWEAPVINRLEVRGGGATSVDSGWVNADYAFNRSIATSATDLPTATDTRTSYSIFDGTIAAGARGVGLFPTASRNTQFSVCATPDVTTALTAAVSCTPVATGGLTATVGSINVPESATNLTNQAYYLSATETDRLGNRVTSNGWAYTPVGGTTVPATSDFDTFGVDRTAPALQTIARSTLTTIAGTDADSIFSTSGTTWTDLTYSSTAATATFAVRVLDARSGFYNCVDDVNCPTGSGAQNSIGTFAIERRRAPTSPSVTNDATIEQMVDPVLGLNRMNASTYSSDATMRQFTIGIAGASSRVPTGSRTGGLTTAVTYGATTPGYYTFTGTVVDRAGNTATVTPRRVVIDNAPPVLTNVVLPPTITGGQTLTATLFGTDDVEITGAEMVMSYTSGALSVAPLRFRRVPVFAATIRSGLFHGPFAALTDGKLASTIGTGMTYGGNVTLPIPVIHDLQVTDAGSAPVTPAGVNKPVRIAAQAFDIRSMLTPAGTTTPWTSLASNTVPTADNINASAVSSDATQKNWTIAAGGAQIVSWGATTTSTSALEYRVSASTSVVNPPFSSVAVIRRAYDATAGFATEYDYLGTATYAGVADEGDVRYFRYTFTPAAVGQGNSVSQAAVGSLDTLRAIGVDSRGNGLMTQGTTSGSTASVSSWSAYNAQLSYPSSSGATYSFWGASSTYTSTTASSVSDSPFVLGSGFTAPTTTTQYVLTGLAYVPAGQASLPVYSCTSNNPAVAKVASSAGLASAGATTATLTGTSAGANAYTASCYVINAGGAGTATITMRVQGSAASNFTATNLTYTATVVSNAGDALAAGALTHTLTNGAAPAAAGTVNLPVAASTISPSVTTFVIGSTFANGTNADHPLTWAAAVSTSLSGTGVSVSCFAQADGTYSCRATNTNTAAATATRTYRIRARAVGGLFFSSPRSIDITLNW